MSTPTAYRPHPLWGWLGPFRQDPTTTLAYIAARQGEITTFRLASRELILVTSPEGVQHVLKDRAGNYIKGRTMDVVRPLMGENVATADGPTWQRWRRLLHPAFRRARLMASVETMVHVVHEFLPALDRQASRGQPVNLMPVMLDLSFAIITRLLLGPLPEIHRQAFTHAFHEAMGLLNRIAWSPYPRLTRLAVEVWPHFRRVRHTLYALTDELIAASGRASASDNLVAYLRSLDNGQITPLEIRRQLLVLLLAGHETTAFTLSWLWAMLARAPVVARRVREEVIAVLGDRPLSAADVDALPYTRAVINEILRLYPAVWVIARDSVAEDRIGHLTVLPGRRIIVSPFVTHRSAARWAHPEAFWPERFLDFQASHPFHFYPFGGGPRKCLGYVLAPLEMLAVVTTLIRRYEMEAVPGVLPQPRPILTLRPHPGVWVRLRPV